jgi:hypothetical protein
MQANILLFSVSEFFEYLEKNIDQITGQIVHLTTLSQPGDRPSILHLYVTAKVKVGDTLVHLEIYCGEVVESDKHSEEVAIGKTLHIQKEIEEECARLGLTVDRGLYAEKKDL